MASKTAYLWGTVSCFSGSLAAHLLQKGWQVHLATKSAFQVSLSPLDLHSTAQSVLEKALGSHERFKTFQDRLRFMDASLFSKSTTYDAVIFCGLPANYDEARVSRAPWAAREVEALSRRFKGAPLFIISSLWGAIQPDGVVPEEIECERRKPKSPYEIVAQQYEENVLKGLSHHQDSPWYLLRLPLITGDTKSGKILNFSGLAPLLEKFSGSANGSQGSSISLNYNPDSSLWFMPIDVASNLICRFIEDAARPRICNLVSTQVKLNREWLHDLAQAAGFKKVVAGTEDNFSLSKNLRTMLTDNILVKTRGLFEVMGRYQQAPAVTDSNYFRQLLQYGNEHNWGKPAAKKNESTAASTVLTEKQLNDYLVNVLPSNLNEELTDLAEKAGGSFGFSLDGHNMSWLLTVTSGRTNVQILAGDAPKPGVICKFSNKATVQILEGKLSIEKAFIMQQLLIESNPYNIYRAFAFVKKLFHDIPFKQLSEEHGFSPAEK